MCIAHLYDFFPALKFNKAILHQLFSGGNMVRTHFCEKKNREIECDMIPTCFHGSVQPKTRLAAAAT